MKRYMNALFRLTVSPGKLVFQFSLLKFSVLMTIAFVLSTWLPLLYIVYFLIGLVLDSKVACSPCYTMYMLCWNRSLKILEHSDPQSHEK